jgi:hypothetical protein
MNLLIRPPLIVVVVAAFLLRTFISCTPTAESTKELEKYDGYEYADEAVFNRPYERTFRAAIASLEAMGFTIALSDERNGAIQGECETSDRRAEELRQEGLSESSNPGEVVAGVLAAIFVALIMVFVSSGCQADDGDDSVDINISPSPRTTHIYVMTLDLRSDQSGATIVAVGAARFYYEDGMLVSSIDLENKYFNHVLFDRMEAHLVQEESASDSSRVD